MSNKYSCKTTQTQNTKVGIFGHFALFDKYINKCIKKIRFDNTGFHWYSNVSWIGNINIPVELLIASLNKTDTPQDWE